MNAATESNAIFLTRPPYFTQPAIFERMAALLATQMPDLTTRDPSDPTIAMLDVWAMVLDVMSFYQQQFNNESYLTTAKELDSVRQLARMINHELNPGVAANAYLAFKIDLNANNTGVTVIPQGTQVQSLPNQGALPQTFETSQNFTAYAAWNQLQPKQPQKTLYQTVSGNDTSLWLAGTTNGLVQGDVLLLQGSVTLNNNNYQPIYQLVVQHVLLDAKNNRTQVVWQSQWASVASQDLSGNNIILAANALSNLQLWSFNYHVAAFGNNAPLVSSLPAASYYMQPGRNDWDEKSQVSASSGANPPGTIPSVWQDSQASNGSGGVLGTSFAPTIYLNQSLTGILVNSYILLTNNGMQKLYQVNAVSEVSRSDFGISGQVTALSLQDVQAHEPATNNPAFTFRNTAIYAQSELLPLYTSLVNDESIILQDKIQGITLNGIINNLSSGQSLIISNLLENISEPVLLSGAPLVIDNPPPLSNQYIYTLTAPLTFHYQPGTTSVSFVDTAGNPASVAVTLDVDAPATPKLIIFATSPQLPNTVTQLTLSGLLVEQGEVFTLLNTQDINGQTVLYPTQNLQNSYSPFTSTIYANVVLATNGATIAKEVLGSGDGTQTNQSFRLNKPPLTYLSAPNASGIQSTLSIQVNGVTWTEAPELYGLSANSKCYTVNQENNGQITITFGDGAQGARLPTGQENITATYRQGIGTTGMVTSKSLTLLQTRPQGVTGVTNPLPASGAADPESLTTAYKTAPSTVLTMGRIVSLRDYISFTQAYAGISKVDAKLLQSGNQPVLYLTVASESGVAIDPSSALYTNLLSALIFASNSNQNLTILSYAAVSFNVSASLVIDSAYAVTQVINQVTQALLNRYGFDQQNLVQNVTASAVIEVMQAIPGVAGVELQDLYFSTDSSPSLQSILPALPARMSAGVALPAQLLTINANAGGIILQRIT